MKELSQGIIIDEWKYYVEGLEGTITYPSGNSITYSQEGEGAVFSYHVGERCIRLNDLAPLGWIIQPVDGKFQTRYGMANSNPKILFGLYRRGDFPGLLESELALFSALHEIGHACLNETLRRLFMESDVESCVGSQITEVSSAEKLFQKEILLSKSYGEQIYAANEFFSKKIERFHRFDERWAWAFALRTLKREGFLPEISKEQLRKLYVKALRSYGSDYHR